MHIAGYMAALKVADLGHMPKAALLAVAARADRKTGAVWLPIGRIAADLGVHYHTARRALEKAVEGGYLNVDKSPGRRPEWTLTSRLVREVAPRTTSRTERDYLAHSARLPRAQHANRGSLKRSTGTLSLGEPPTKGGARSSSNGDPPAAPVDFIAGTGRTPSWDADTRTTAERVAATRAAEAAIEADLEAAGLRQFLETFGKDPP